MSTSDPLLVSDVTDSEELKKLISASTSLIVVHFWTSWSEPCKQMNEALEELAKEHDNVKFLKIEAESFPEVSISYEVVAVPTVLFIKNGKPVDRVNGAYVPEVAKKTAFHSSSGAPPLPPPAVQLDPPKPSLDVRLRQIINTAPVMLFMKGTPEEPRCGFSRQTVELLTEFNADFSSFNILSDEEIRQGLKKLSNWPTYPQLYIKGEFVGGLDILKEMKENQSLDSMLPKCQSLEDRMKQLINKAPVMLFMKGNPEQPRCGFSSTVCEILKENSIQFDSFDILQDDDVRQGLKKFSNWPTFPQLYAKGELIGGLDIVKELKDSGELVSTLKAT